MANHDEHAAAGAMTATELAERAEQAIEQAKVAPDADRLVTSAVTVGQRGRIRGWLHGIRPSVVTGGLPTLPLLALMGVSFLAYFDLAIQGVAAPEIRDFFGLDLTQLGLFNTLSGVVGLLIALPVGFFADRINRSRMTAIGLAVLAGFSLLTGGAPTIVVFAV